jgi:hypothetical protein
MLQRLLVALILAVGLLGAGLAWALAGPDRINCCEKDMDCCHRSYDCCTTPKKKPCCAMGYSCCKHTSACCKTK